MSEFKFACPICGQHITADSSTSGGQLTCPTCFRKIVVPQAPASGESKFVLSAAEVSKPRPTSASGSPIQVSDPSEKKTAIPIIAIALVALLAVAGGGVYFFRDKIFKKPPEQQASTTSNTKSNAPGKKKAPPAPRVTYPIPTNITWSLELTNADLPEATAVGKIHGGGFFCERAILQGVAAKDAKTPGHCDLNLRQGKSGPPDLGITVQLFAQQGEELSGKTIEISADRPPPIPKVILRWKDDQDKAVNHTVNDGYALKLVFGDAANGRIPGKIYIAVPDDAKSVIAGTFNAEVRKPAPPKAKQPPKNPKPAK
jgi:hypothetical protein